MFFFPVINQLRVNKLFWLPSMYVRIKNTRVNQMYFKHNILINYVIENSFNPI
jgi:hypothetical protein